MKYNNIRLDSEGPTLHITLNRPDVLNSINHTLALELLEALRNVRNSNEIRVVIIRAEGRAFCAGQDIEELKNPNFGPEDFRAILRDRLNPIVREIRTLPVPVIAVVQGVAAGAGANIALAADFVLAAENSNFIQAFVNIGLLPDSGGTYLLPRTVGLQRATAISMLGEKQSATELLSLGLIYKVAPLESLMEEAAKLAATLSKKPKLALQAIKEALFLSFSASFDEQLKREEDMQVELSKTEDYREGVAAFLEKRPPRFHAPKVQGP